MYGSFSVNNSPQEYLPLMGGNSEGGSQSHHEQNTKTTPTANHARKPKQRPTILIVESMCCHKEVPLVTDILMAVTGVHKVDALIALRQVAVWHACDGTVLPQQLADALNKGHLGASVYKAGYTPPSDTIAASAQDSTSGPGNEKESSITAKRFPFCCCRGGGSGVSHNFGLYIATFLWLLSYAGDWPDLDHSASLGLHSLSLVSMLWTLPTVSNRALLLLRRGVIDINTLMVLAALGSVAIGDWSEGAAVLALFALGEQLESSATGSARRAIEAIVSLQPEEAVVLMSAADAADGPEQSKGEESSGGLVGVRMAVDEISVGSLIALRPGDCVPLDCRVVSGSSLIDEASLTGESVPVRKKVGDALSGGTVNIGTGYLEAETTAVSEDSAVARLGRLVQQAQMERSPTERTVEKVSRVYTPLVVAMAAIVAALPLILGHENAGHPLDPWYWPRTALVLLVLACPCALVLSTPIAYVSSLAFAARRGILIRGGQHLETLAGLTTLAIDKTGTLTRGAFTVGDFVLLDGLKGGSSDSNGTFGDEGSSIRVGRVMSFVQAAEQGSSHPLAMALIAEAKRRNAPPIIGRVTDVSTIPGKGIRATIVQPTCGSSEEKQMNNNNDENNDNKNKNKNSKQNSNDKKSKTVVVEIGNTAMATELGWIGQLRMTGELLPPVKEWEARGATVVWVGVNGVPQLVISCADAVRREASDAISRLHALGVSCVMLTGDNQGAAEQVAKATGLDHFYAGLLPEDKVSWVRAMQQPGFSLDSNSSNTSNKSNKKSALFCRWLNPRWWCRRLTRSGGVRQGDEEEGGMLVTSADGDGVRSSSACGVVGMVGDGINDAPALAAAAVGVAMGVKGTAVAMETADVALMDSDLCKLSLAVEIGRRCKSRIWCNIFLAISVKVIFFALALTGNVTLAMAAVTDVGGMLLVTLNSVSLLANEGPFDVVKRKLLLLLCWRGKGSKDKATYNKLDGNALITEGAVVHAAADDDNEYEHGDDRQQDLEMGHGGGNGYIGEGAGAAAAAAAAVACTSGCCAPEPPTISTVSANKSPLAINESCLVDVSDVACSDGCCSSEVDVNGATTIPAVDIPRDRVDNVYAAAAHAAPAYSSVVAEAGCSSGCCGDDNGKAAAAVIDVAIEPTDAGCSSGCCGGDDTDKAAALIVAVTVESTEAACSSGCCGGDDTDKAAATVDVAIESTEADCSTGCCGGDDSDKAVAPAVDVVPVESTEVDCSSGCCGGDDSDKAVAPAVDVVPVESTEASCSSGCCGGDDTDKAVATVDVAIESTEADCSSGCCGGDDTDKAAATVDVSTESTETDCSSGCCGGDDSDKTADVDVDVAVEPAETSCSSGCCGDYDSDKVAAAAATVDVVVESTETSCSSGCCGDTDSDKAAVDVAVEPTEASCSSGCCGGDDSEKDTAAAAVDVAIEPSEASCSSGCCGSDASDKSAVVDVAAESTEAGCTSGCCGGDDIDKATAVEVVVESTETSCSSGCCGGDSDKAAVAAVDVDIEPTEASCSSGCCGGDTSDEASAVDVPIESTKPSRSNGCCGRCGCCGDDDDSDKAAVAVESTEADCSSGCCGGDDTDEATLSVAVESVEVACSSGCCGDDDKVIDFDSQTAV